MLYYALTVLVMSCVIVLFFYLVSSMTVTLTVSMGLYHRREAVDGRKRKLQYMMCMSPVNWREVTSLSVTRRYESLISPRGECVTGVTSVTSVTGLPCVQVSNSSDSSTET